MRAGSTDNVTPITSVESIVTSVVDAHPGSVDIDRQAREIADRWRNAGLTDAALLAGARAAVERRWMAVEHATFAGL